MRSGRYKYQMVSQEELLKEAPLFLEKIKPLEPKALPVDYFAQAELSAAYILEYCKIRYAKKYKGSPLSWEKVFTEQEYANCLKLGPNAKMSYQEAHLAFDDLKQNEYFKIAAAFQLKAIPFSATRSLICWALGLYPLHLYLNVPEPIEVLNYQTRGERVVSLIFKGDEFVEGGREPLGFALHDLIHADHFYRDASVALGQIGFSQWVQRLYLEGRFDDLLASELFRKEFYYTVSDMNAYCVHLLKCLKANILNWHLEKEGKKSDQTLSEYGRLKFEKFWIELFKTQDEQLTQQILLLNGCERDLNFQSLEKFLIPTTLVF